MKYQLLEVRGRLYFFLLLNLCFCVQLSAATYRNYVSQEVIGNTVRIWIDSDTALGEAAMAELRWGSAPNYSYSGVIAGSFDDSSVVGANWFVDISLAGVGNTADLQLATRNQSGMNYGFTDFIYMLSALPVEFSSITTTANTTSITLNYQTVSETNNNYFEIERSINSKEWTKIAFQKGAGTSYQTQHYKVVDRQPVLGLNYYRIKQVDYDGSYAYSPIVSALWKQEEVNIFLSPNPATDQLTISGLEWAEETILMNIFTASGQLLQQQYYTGQTIDITALTSGHYYLQLSTTQRLLGQQIFIIP